MYSLRGKMRRIDWNFPAFCRWRCLAVESRVLSLKLNEALSEMNNGNLTSTTITQACIEQMNQLEHLNVFVTRTADLARRQAEESDNRRHKGLPLGRLDGIPVTVKDNFAVEGVTMTCGSKILQNFISPYTSTVVQRLLDEGAVLLGKTNLDEFAMGSGGTASAQGATLNPWRQECQQTDDEPVVGGSSGGSAAAVSANICYGSLGSDTGGSVRLPASFCGIVGYQPSYGRAPRHGLVPLASSLDCPGVLTRSVQDAALLGDVICGHDPWDGTSSAHSPLSTLIQLDEKNPLKGLKLGIPEEFAIDELSPECYQMWMEAADWLHDAGAEVRVVSLPSLPMALACYTAVCAAEASSNMAKYDGLQYGPQDSAFVASSAVSAVGHCRDHFIGQHVKERIALGTFVLLSERTNQKRFTLAAKARRLIHNDLQMVMKRDCGGVDALLCPVVPGPAFCAGEMSFWMSIAMTGMFTAPSNVAGLPAISVPCGLSKQNLPLGLQVLGRRFEDDIMFKVALALEANAHFPYLKGT